LEVVPCTVAPKESVPLVIDDAVKGDTVTEVTPEPDGWPAAATVTVAVADFVGSATLVAVIVIVPPLAGAVKTPALVIVPVEAIQVTELFVVVPWIAAVNWALAPAATEVAAGETTTELTAFGAIALPMPTHPEMPRTVEARKATNTRTLIVRRRFILLSFFPKLILFRALRPVRQPQRGVFRRG
jgi:hypothetical protein